MSGPMRTKDYHFAQDLKYMPGEIANTLLCNFATFPHVFCFRFALILYTYNHFLHIIVSFCADKPRTAHGIQEKGGGM